MAMNPMQRRARNSFLIGFLVALIIMAVVVLLLVSKIKEAKEEAETLRANIRKDIYVAARDLKSGAKLESTDLRTEDVQSTVPDNQIVTVDDLYGDGTGVILKIDVPEGEILTKEMIEPTNDTTEASDRIFEYNMFVLPSTLKNGDFIDIRLLLPSGKDYIVLPKKRVLGCNETTIWLKVSEDEILLLNNAIVEAYTISGSKLYASLYAEAGMQDSAIATYLPSTQVAQMFTTGIEGDPNILEEAKTALRNRYDINLRVSTFDSAIDPYRSTQDSIVASKNSEEVSAIKAARQGFVAALEGNEDEIGYTR